MLHLIFNSLGFSLFSEDLAHVSCAEILRLELIQLVLV